jgi:large subunit ribosomal protein L21
MYAIIATGGKQYKVSKGDKLRVEKLDVEVGSKVVFDQVLFVNADKADVGNPTVAGAAVNATVTNQGKDKKIIVYKYKPKTGYHKKRGHRQLFTELIVDDITIDGVVLECKATAEEATKTPAAEKKVSEKAAEKSVEKSTKKTDSKAADDVVETVKEDTKKVTKAAKEEKEKVAKKVKEDTKKAAETVKDDANKATKTAKEDTKEAAGTTEE